MQNVVVPPDVKALDGTFCVHRQRTKYNRYIREKL